MNKILSGALLYAFSLCCVGAGLSVQPSTLVTANPAILQDPAPVSSSVPEFIRTLSDSLEKIGVYEVDTDTGFGSGFCIRDDILVTAAHVVDGATQVFVDGEPATVIMFDKKTDVAVLRIFEKPRVHLRLSHANRGQDVYACGYAGYGDATGIHGEAMTCLGQVVGFTEGYVTVNTGGGPGMSGGPLLDENGNVCGIASHAFAWGFSANPSLMNFVPSEWIRVVLSVTDFDAPDMPFPIGE